MRGWEDYWGALIGLGAWIAIAALCWAMHKGRIK